MNELHQRALRHLAERGIDPDTVEVDDPPPFDPVVWRVEQAQAALAANIPARFRHAEADHPGVIAWAQLYLADPDAAPNLLLIGATGTGKTHQAYGALRSVVLGTAGRGRALTWRATTHPALNADLRVQPNDEHLAAHERYATVDVLLVDDLGAGKASDWTADSLYRLVDHRWANQLPIIATTNLDPDTLRNTVGDRITSRFADGTVIPLKGVDRRRDRGTTR